MKRRNVFICTADVSGDVLGARLATELRRQQPGLQIFGAGGGCMREAGVALVAETMWSVLGIPDGIVKSPQLVVGINRIKAELSRMEPGLYIAIDSGKLNFEVIRFVRQLGWKILYFVPPKAHARKRQGKDLPHLTDAVVTPFSWSASMLQIGGANAHYWGHPSHEMAQRKLDELLPAGSSRMDRLAILPGSRPQETKLLLPVLAKVARLMELPIVLVAAPSVDKDTLLARWHALTGRLEDVVHTDADEVLLTSRVACICSGTAALQGALCDCPMVVVYKVNFLTEINARVVMAREKMEHISLPNIVLQRGAIPEFLQRRARPRLIASEIARLHADGPARTAQLESFEAIRRLTASDRVFGRTAALAISLLDDDVHGGFTAAEE